MNSFPYRYLARVIIQFTTPFLVGGENDDIFTDNMFVKDSNGLPAIPGTTIAGILRHN